MEPIEDDWLGSLMNQANQKAPRQAPAGLPPAPTPPPPLYQGDQQNEAEPFKRFLDLWFYVSGVGRQCYYGFSLGGRDIFWLLPHESDQHAAFVFDSDPLERERVYHHLKEKQDLTKLGKLRSKPNR